MNRTEIYTTSLNSRFLIPDSEGITIILYLLSSWQKCILNTSQVEAERDTLFEVA